MFAQNIYHKSHTSFLLPACVFRDLNVGVTARPREAAKSTSGRDCTENTDLFAIKSTAVKYDLKH